MAILLSRAIVSIQVIDKYTEEVYCFGSIFMALLCLPLFSALVLELCKKVHLTLIGTTCMMHAQKNGCLVESTVTDCWSMSPSNVTSNTASQQIEFKATGCPNWKNILPNLPCRATGKQSVSHTCLNRINQLIPWSMVWWSYQIEVHNSCIAKYGGIPCITYTCTPTYYAKRITHKRKKRQFSPR